MSSQGQVYTDFIAGELANEEVRRKDINARAFAATGTSGIQFTLAGAVLVLVRAASSGPSRVLLIVALALYLCSAAFALWSSRGVKSVAADAQAMRLMLTTHWVDDEVTAKNFVARLHIRSVECLRDGNNSKAWWLKTAILFQVVAVLALTAGCCLLA